MVLSIILVVLFASEYLSQAEMNFEDLLPKIPTIKPENIREPQPFYCTSEKNNGASTVLPRSPFACPENMLYTNCTCQGTCQQPHICTEDCVGNLSCICPRDQGYLFKGGDCVPLHDCGCYLNQSNVVIPDGESYVTDDCSSQWNCREGYLSSGSYQCSENAACTSEQGVFTCTCNHDYFGNGQNCQSLNCLSLFQTGYIKDCPSCSDPNNAKHCYCNDTNSDKICDVPTDCQDIYNSGFNESGAYTIKPLQRKGLFDVYCDITNDTGWTVFQRRLDGSLNFNRNRTMYEDGFGSLSHEFWLGLKQIKTLLKSNTYKLRIELVSKQHSNQYSEYGEFRFRTGGYKPLLGEYNGDAGDALLCHKGRSFNVFNDGDGSRSKKYGGWWRKRSQKYCEKGTSNLNGDYFSQNDTGIIWGDVKNITYTEMKLSKN